jgi:uncharacterized protein (DUF4213/DUF364 family)/predicted secreted protein
MIAARMHEVLHADAARARAVDVRIGLGYTAVLTDAECAGVAYTPREDLDHGCSPLREAGPLAGRRVSDLLPYLESRKPIERAIGLAAANALVAARPPASVTGGDILRVLALRPTDRVGMVGCFGPLIAFLQAQVSSLTVFERSGNWATDVQPAERALELLPHCSVALITSTALLTDTVDTLLDAAAGCREVALLGPSTPLLPEVFVDTPVTWLSGIRIENPAQVLRIISEGGGTRTFSPYVQKLNLRLHRRDEEASACTWDNRHLVRRLAQVMGIGCERDRRSRRVVLAIDCILNQNARDRGAATFPALNWEVLRLCEAFEVGVVQMPCPEMEFLGIVRERPPGTSIRAALDTDEGRTCCRRISVEVVDRVQKYVRQGYQILAILGGNPDSPGCAVHGGPAGLLATSGVLMRELQDELRQRNMEVPFRGIRDCDPIMMAEDIKWLQGVFSKEAQVRRTPNHISQ